MRRIMNFATIFSVTLFIATSAGGEVRLDEEREPSVPIPYSFTYTAGRYPGHIDRVHAETSDGESFTRGMFSYIDPRSQVRTVEYLADKDGFHPLVITNPVTDTKAVAAAKEKHLELYDRIAAQHEEIKNERQRLGLEDNGEYHEELYPPNPNIVINHPRDTAAVEHAKERHFNLYERIAEDHARIAAERKQENPEEDYISQPKY